MDGIPGHSQLWEMVLKQRLIGCLTAEILEVMRILGGAGRQGSVEYDAAQGGECENTAEDQSEWFHDVDWFGVE